MTLWTITLLSRPPRAPLGPQKPQNHISETIHHRPQLLYIFGILESRPPPSCIQNTNWTPPSPPRGSLLMGYLYSYILKGSDQNGHKIKFVVHDIYYINDHLNHNFIIQAPKCPPGTPRDPQPIYLKLSTRDPMCYIFLEYLGPDPHPPAFRLPSGPPMAPQMGGLLIG